MYAIASLLDPSTEREVRALWARFEEKCSLTRIKSLPIPHFTWLAADSLQFSAVETVLNQLTPKIQPFEVRAAGIGIFTGPLPVIYINLVKNSLLLESHRMLWESVRPFTVVPNSLYHPDNWVPHITLAYQEVDPVLLGCAVQDIVYRSLEFSLVIDNISVISNTNDQSAIWKKFPLQKDSVV